MGAFLDSVVNAEFQMKNQACYVPQTACLNSPHTSQGHNELHRGLCRRCCRCCIVLLTRDRGGLRLHMCVPQATCLLIALRALKETLGLMKCF